MKELQDLVKQTKSYLEYVTQTHQKIQSYESQLNLLKAEEENLKKQISALNYDVLELNEKKEKIDADLKNQAGSILAIAQEKALKIENTANDYLKEAKIKFYEIEKKEKEADSILSKSKVFAQDLENREDKVRKLQEAIKSYG